MKSELVITTSTFYSDADCPRARCAVKMIENANELGISIVIVEGGSPKEFREEISDLGAIVLDEVPHARGVMGPGRRQAIAKGFEVTGGKISGYVEIEKYCMPMFVEELVRPILLGKVDICVPRRLSLETYPTAQRYAEPLGNLHFLQATGLDFDMWFGPRFFNQTAGKYFLEYDDEYGGSWDPTHIPTLRCAAAGLRVATPMVPYVHPQEQTDEEENSAVFTFKRAAQLSNLMAATEKEAKRLGLPRAAVLT